MDNLFGVVYRTERCEHESIMENYRIIREICTYVKIIFGFISCNDVVNKFAKRTLYPKKQSVC